MYAGSISVPCHVPVVIVPTVVIFVLPVLLEISSVVANVPVTAGKVKFVVPVEVIKLTLLAPVKVTSALVVKSPAILNEWVFKVKLSASRSVKVPAAAVPEPIASGADQSMYAGSISVPCHVPVVIVPNVVIVLLPV